MTKDNKLSSLASEYFRPILGLRNHNQSFLKWKVQKQLVLLSKGMDIFPLTFEVDLVNFCNHSCKWCLDKHHGNSTLSLEIVRSFTEEINHLNINGTRCQGILFKGGGEPTLHPDFIQCVKYFSRTHCDLGIITNGSQLHRAEIRQILNKHVCYVRISLDAGTPNSHVLTHKSHDFDKIVYGSRKLVNERKTEIPSIGLTFIIEPAHLGEIKNILLISKEISPDYIQLRMPYLQEVFYSSDYTTEQWENTYTEMKSCVNAEIGIPVYLSDYKPSPLCHSNADVQIEKRMKFCRAHRLMGVLTGDSWILGCCEHRNLPEYRFGKLSYPEMPLKKIWESEQRQRSLNHMDNAHCLANCTSPVSSYNDAILALGVDSPFCTSFI